MKTLLCLLATAHYANGARMQRASSRLSASARATSRRSACAGLAAAVSLPLLGSGAAVADEEPLIDVYFGCGCFWHVQHEFVEAERRILGRKDAQITARAGYAGGNAGALNGKVCYHNAAQISDYGGLGHAEVVAMQIPPSSFGEFAKEYVRLFDKNGYRPDQWGDRGPEYRNLVGMPGGSKSPLAKQLVAASIAEGDKLDFAVGKGNDGDARGLTWLMDTSAHPFYLGEIYHQFHDGFNWGEDYPAAYNKLAQLAVKEGRLEDRGCPNGMLGVGIAGL